MKITTLLIVFIIAAFGIFIFIRSQNQFELPKGKTAPLEDTIEVKSETSDVSNQKEAGVQADSDNTLGNKQERIMQQSTRKIFITDGTKHSIPLNEILSGGPPKDGIPSIDNPKFVRTAEADEFLSNEDPGLGFIWKGEARFYPYQILVFHEIVNDTVQGDPVLVTYCPLCATGIVFERLVDGKEEEFGVSGKLWQSNLLMYNRSSDPQKESLWSQVLGEAVLGESTGIKLTILPSDTVRYGDWKKKNPGTKVLSRDTGAARSYGRDPYGDYYTNTSVSFGATFNDTRLHPKAFVLGIELDGKFKAYHEDALREGITVDTFSNRKVTIEKSSIGEVRMFIGESKTPIPYIGSFWFSWLAVHPETELFKQ